MNFERQKRIYDLYLEALDVPVQDRPGYLREKVEGDQDMLAVLQEMLKAAGAIHNQIQEEEPEAKLGMELGPYTLEEVLGAGGMGKVFLAKDRLLHRQVAIKFLDLRHLQQEWAQRFRLEQTIQGGINHFNIARLYETGCTLEGTPFIVMEYVPGKPITTFCKQAKLTIHQRVALTAAVCKGVAAAHNKGIIHRDLKPSNILVLEREGQAVPKIIDFGIAKMMDEEMNLTLTKEFFGTLHYMSPEQVGMGPGDGQRDTVDMRTDVYALGVVLFELVTGKKPLFWPKDTALMTMLEDICRKEPASPARTWSGLPHKKQEQIAAEMGLPPGQVGRLLKGDLGRIIGKAMAKNKSDRYAGAMDFSQDLERYLEGAPVLASDLSMRYLIRVQARRYRHSLTAASVLAGMGLLAILAFTLASVREQRKIEFERGLALEVTESMVKMFQVSEPEINLGHQITARELLDRATHQIESLEGKDPRLKARLQSIMAGNYARLGLPEPAIKLYNQAILTYEPLAGHQGVKGDLTLQVIRLLVQQHRLEEAAKQLEKWRAEGGSNREKRPKNYAPPSALEVQIALKRADYPTADRKLKELIGKLTLDGSEGLPFLSEAFYLCGQIAEHQEEPLQALEWYQRSEAQIAHGDQPDIHFDLLKAKGSLLTRLGSHEPARESWQRAAALVRLNPVLRHKAAEIQLLLGNQLAKEEKWEEAEGAYAEALILRENGFGTNHPNVAESLAHLGLLMLDRHQEQLAEACFDDLLAQARRLDPNHLSPITLRALSAWSLRQGFFQEVLYWRDLLPAQRDHQASKAFSKMKRELDLMQVAALWGLERKDEAQTEWCEFLAEQTKEPQVFVWYLQPSYENLAHQFGIH